MRPLTGMIMPLSLVGHTSHLATRTTYDAAGRPITVENGYLASWQSEQVLPQNWSRFTALSSVETTYNALSRKLTDGPRAELRLIR